MSYTILTFDKRSVVEPARVQNLQLIWYILTGAYAVYPLMNFNTGNGGVIHYQMLTTGATKIISHDSVTELYIMYYFSGVATCLGLC